MRLIERTSIAAVVEASPIAAVAAEYGIELVPLGPRLRIGRCPLHPDAVGRSLLIELDAARFRCLTCTAGGDVVGLVMQLDHLGMLAALARLARRAGLDFDALFPEWTAIRTSSNSAPFSMPRTSPRRRVRQAPGEVPLWALTPPSFLRRGEGRS